MTQLSIKRGDTLALDCEVAGDLSGWTVRAQIRGTVNDALLSECVVSVLAYDAEDEVTRYALTVAPNVTATWAPGRAVMDIEYTDPNGMVQSTETILIQIERDVTRTLPAP
jgi:hypothetical protein